MSNETTMAPVAEVVDMPNSRRDVAVVERRAEGASIDAMMALLDKSRAVAERLAKSRLVPKAYQGQPDDLMIAVALGARVGLDPLTAMQGIAVINGRPTLWGDAALAVCRAHPDWQDMTEELQRPIGADGRPNVEEFCAVCTVQRRGESPQVATFSVSDAKRARLWGKEGPWSQYPQRMLVMRARSWALRAAFADALSGMVLTEEAYDMEPLDVTPQRPAIDALPEGQRTSMRMPPAASPQQAASSAPTPIGSKAGQRLHIAATKLGLSAEQQREICTKLSGQEHVSALTVEQGAEFGRRCQLAAEAQKTAPPPPEEPAGEPRGCDLCGVVGDHETGCPDGDGGGVQS